MTTFETPFEKKLRERRELALATASRTSTPPVAGAPTSPAPGTSAVNHNENIPDLGDDDLSLSEEEEALDQAIKQLGIIEAYRIWCGKMTPKFGAGQKESIMVSCPNPAHPDKNPSAWLNRDKDTYYCSGCAQGGDIWDIAAYHFGMPLPGYKQDAQTFRLLREKMGADLGFTAIMTITGGTVMVAPVSTTVVAEEPKEEEQAPAKVGILPAAAVEQEEKEERERHNKNVPTIDWRNIVPTGTFLFEYLEATTVDTCPEEFHFWNGVLAIGMGIGREVVLRDSDPVVGNLFVCLTGPSSAGKSRSKRHLDKMLMDYLPYDKTNKLSRGAKIIKAPGSAEYLVSSFTSMDEVMMPGKTVPMRTYYPVRGLIQFEELSQLMSTAGRLGNAIRPQLMDLYDSPRVMESGSQAVGERHAEHPFGSVISTTQNRSLRKLLDKGDDGSGFINRWIFAQGKLKPRISMGGAEIDIASAGKMLAQIHQWAFKGRKLDMSPEALKAWDDFFHATLVPAQEKADESGTAVLARLDLTMKKLFLLFSSNALEDIVSKDTVDRVIKLWPYLVKTFGVVHIEMRKTETSDLQDQVMAQIKRLKDKNSKAPSRKEIYDCVKHKISDTKELVDMLTILVKAELIHEVPPPAGVRGRPTMRYEVA